MKHQRRHQQYGRYDQALLNAKNSKKLVKLDLALDTSFTDNEGRCEGQVLEVDKYAIKMHLSKPHSCIEWIGKSFIVGTEVLNASN